MQGLVETILETLPAEAAIMIVAALPVIEVRGAIPLAVTLGLPPLYGTFLSFVGSMIPFPFVFFFVRPIFRYLRSKEAVKHLVDSFIERTMRNNRDKVEKYGALGLLLLVAIPLPGTGVWTGSIVAALMDMRFKLACPAIFIGNAIAAIIVMVVSYGVAGVVG